MFIELIEYNIGCMLYLIKRINNHFIRKYISRKFFKFGRNVYIGPNGIFSFKNIEIGNDVYIGPNAIFQTSFGKIKIGNHVMFGPGVNIHGGNHRVNEVGVLLKHASNKINGDDGEILIDDDCWIGANVIILSNVVIGKGSVIGAGSIVTKSIQPYSIYTGMPPKQIRNRFTPKELNEHIRMLKGDL